MVDFIRTEAALQALFPDNADRLISAQNLRDFLVSTTVDINFLRNLPVRYAILFPGADIGAKVNAAIADLPADGGKVMLPYGSEDYSTSIDIANRSNIWLQGYGMPTRHTNHLPGKVYVGTELHYTGSGAAILIGPVSEGGDSNLCTDCRLQGFQLRFNATADYGVYVRAWAPAGYLRDFAVRGTGGAGTGFFTEGTGNHAWHFYNAQFRYCAIGADLNQVHNFSASGGTTFNVNGIGCRIGNVNGGGNLNFCGVDAEGNTDACFDIVAGAAINFFGGYSELAAGFADRIVFRIGDTAEIPLDINIYGYYVNASTSADYIFEVNRVNGLNVTGCTFTGSGPGHVINNVHTDVKRIELPNDRYVNDLINDTTGVISYTDKNGYTIYPNMPAVPDGLPSGAFWSDSGVIKIV